MTTDEAIKQIQTLGEDYLLDWCERTNSRVIPYHFSFIVALNNDDCLLVEEEYEEEAPNVFEWLRYSAKLVTPVTKTVTEWVVQE